jgi:hypothetical protein
VTNHKSVPPSRPQPRQSVSGRFRESFDEHMAKPSKKASLFWRVTVKVFAALFVGTLLLCAVGVMVWLVQWIDGML